MLRKELAKSLPRENLPAPDHAREMCLDLLHAKQEALDHGAEFPVPAVELCSRCKALFATLDLTQEVCVELRTQAGVPEDLQDILAQSTATS